MEGTGVEVGHGRPGVIPSLHAVAANMCSDAHIQAVAGVAHAHQLAVLLIPPQYHDVLHAQALELVDCHVRLHQVQGLVRRAQYHHLTLVAPRCQRGFEALTWGGEVAGRGGGGPDGEDPDTLCMGHARLAHVGIWPTHPMDPRHLADTPYGPKASGRHTLRALWIQGAGKGELDRAFDAWDVYQQPSSCWLAECACTCCVAHTLNWRRSRPRKALSCQCCIGPSSHRPGQHWPARQLGR